jgi:hypothetical protein
MRLNRFDTDRVKKTKSKKSDGLLARRAVDHIHPAPEGACGVRIDVLPARRFRARFFERKLHLANRNCGFAKDLINESESFRYRRGKKNKMFAGRSGGPGSLFTFRGGLYSGVEIFWLP